jgi:hypothetical protein
MLCDLSFNKCQIDADALAKLSPFFPRLKLSLLNERVYTLFGWPHNDVHSIMMNTGF